MGGRPGLDSREQSTPAQSRAASAACAARSAPARFAHPRHELGLGAPETAAVGQSATRNAVTELLKLRQGGSGFRGNPSDLAQQRASLGWPCSTPHLGSVGDVVAA